MNRLTRLCLTALTFVSAACASAQTTVCAWNFDASNLTPSTGTGTATVVSTTGSFVGGNPSTGKAWSTTGYPAQGTNSGSAGVEFAVPTSGQSNIKLTWDQQCSNTGTRWTKVLYSTDGTTFIDAPLGTGPGASTTLNGVFENVGGGTWFAGRSIDFTGITAVENNANFKVRIVSIFAPTTNAYAAASTSSTYGTGGTVRFDNVKIEAAGTPTSTPPGGSGAITPATVCKGNNSVATIRFTAIPGSNPASTSLTVTANLTNLGGGAAVPLTLTTTANVYELLYTVPASSGVGAQSVSFTVSDNDGPGGTPRTNPAPITASTNILDCTGNPSTTPVVISQVYGGGQNATGVYKNDYVELFNRSSTTQSLNGLSVQYASSGGAFNTNSTIVLPNVSIEPGKYYLIQVSAPGTAGADLPTPDLALPTSGQPNPNNLVTAFGMANDNGKVALVNGTTAIAGICNAASVLDLVGYGTASCYEGGVAVAALDPTKAALRKNNGCQDTQQNADDFVAGTPAPRNSASPANPCTPVTTNYTLTVTRAGIVGGTITSAPAGITCGSTCSFDFASGTSITLTATPADATKQRFYSWTGAGTTNPDKTRTVTLTAAASVEARFACIADVATLGGAVGPDDSLTADDLILFLSSFFSSDPIADIATLGGGVGSDGQYTADDLILFLGLFFNGCP